MRNTLFHNRGDGTFEEIADYAGVPASDWSWSPYFLDVDLDGYEDLLIATGHMKDVQDMDAIQRVDGRSATWKNLPTVGGAPEGIQPSTDAELARKPSLRTRPIVAFRNLGNLKFEEVTRLVGHRPARRASWLGHGGFRRRRRPGPGCQQSQHRGHALPERHQRSAPGGAAHGQGSQHPGHRLQNHAPGRAGAHAEPGSRFRRPLLVRQRGDACVCGGLVSP